MMMNRALISGIVIGGLVFLAAACPLGAATISDFDTFGPTALPFGGVTVTLDKFDPALGTLTKVTIKLEATTDSGTIDWDNEAAIPTDVTLGIGAEVTATAPLLAALVAVPLQMGSALGIAADNDGAADFIGADAFSVTGGSGSDSDEDFTTNPADFPTFTAGFVGDTFDTTIDSVVTNYLSTTGGFGPINPTPGQAYGTITVTYHYIPEPATLSLLVLGGLALIRRRSRMR